MQSLQQHWFMQPLQRHRVSRWRLDEQDQVSSVQRISKMQGLQGTTVRLRQHQVVSFATTVIGIGTPTKRVDSMSSVVAYEIVTDGPTEALVAAYKEAFFGKPPLRDRLSAFGTLRSQQTWAPVAIDGADIGAQLISTTNAVTQSLDRKGRGPGVGYVIAMSVESSSEYGDTYGTVFLDNFTRGLLGGVEQAASLRTYAKGVGTLLERQGYKVRHSPVKN